jgi:hypothetical protein
MDASKNSFIFPVAIFFGIVSSLPHQCYSCPSFPVAQHFHKPGFCFVLFILDVPTLSWSVGFQNCGIDSALSPSAGYMGTLELCLQVWSWEGDWLL